MFKRGKLDIHKAFYEYQKTIEEKEYASSLDQLLREFSPNELKESEDRVWKRVIFESDSHSIPESTKDSVVVSKQRRFHIVLSFAAVLVISIAATLTISANTRELIVGFIRELRGDSSAYTFYEDEHNSNSAFLPELNANELFEGFELTELTDQTVYRREYYVNNSGDTIEYICASADSDVEISILWNNDNRETVDINGFDGDLYHADEKIKENSLVWVDTDTRTVFSIDTTLDIEDIYVMVNSIYKKKIYNNSEIYK